MTAPSATPEPAAAGQGPSVLIVEDDEGIATQLVRGLTRGGYQVDHVTTGAGALARSLPDVVLLDLELPDGDGVSICRALRERSAVAIIVVTAYGEEADRVNALDAGADDYLVKPFESKELLARIRAVVRRKSGFASSTMGSARVTLDMNARSLTFDGQSDDLSAREYALMLALLERPGAILSRQQLEERLYGWGEEVESNAVDAVIYSVRRKFGHAVIRNVRGLGWAVCV